jgi:hydrophobic/amphiphilic exporter-1 (mainly G- bacteria), HAE1 family
MDLPRLAVHRPVTAGMILISALVLGAIAMVRLPQAYLPEVDAPFISVQVPYPDSHPTQVEKEITRPVEETLSTLPAVKRLSSRSRADGAHFELEFDWGMELDVVRMQVSERMDQVRPELPEGIGEILIFSFNTSDIPVIQGRIAASGIDLSESYDLIESRILNRIRRVEGVARVDLEGVAPKEVYIDLVLARLLEHRVPVDEVVRNLRGASSTLVLGEVRDGNLRYTARGVGAFDSIEALQALPINGAGLRLGDVAEIRYEEPILAHGRRLDGHFAVALEVYKESTANTVDVVRSVERVIEEEIAADPLLQGVRLFVWEDQAEAITQGINGLVRAGILGSFLALVCLWFFLRRLDATLIVSLSIPFSILAACGVLFFLGKSLNVLSMMGLILGVGMLVDNAVVVLESIDRSHRDEPDPKAAALLGAREVGMAVAASTLTSLIVFLPLIVGGQSDLTTWLGEVGVAISIALVCSLLASLTLIPLMSAHFLGRRRPRPNPAITWLEDRYERVLGWTLRHRGWATLAFVVTLLGGLSPFFTGMVETAMFSGVVNERLFLGYEFTDFRYKSDVEEVVVEMEEFFDDHREDWGIESIYSFFENNRAGTTLTFRNRAMSDAEFRALRSEIREALPIIPGVRLVFQDDAQSGGSSTYFAVRIFGQESRTLEELGAMAAERLRSIEGVEDVRTAESDGQREVQVTVDRERALRAGLSPGEVADLFSFTLGGTRLARFNSGDREVETWLALRRTDRQDQESLSALPVGMSPEGRPILLGEVADFEVAPRAREIRREGRKARVAVNATYEGKDWDGARSRIAAAMDEMDLPPGYSWSWNARLLDQQDQNRQMLVNFLLALVLVYLVMASLFESLAQPFAIVFSILFSLPGAAWMLALTGTPFNLMAQIGLLILMGIVVNNGIVLLDRMNRLRATGMTTEEAMLAAGRDRLRPILMTAVTTIVGLVPLALRGATVGGIFYFPMARTVMGGLISSALLTLLALPLATLGVEAVARWSRSVWAVSAPAPVSRPRTPTIGTASPGPTA